LDGMVATIKENMLQSGMEFLKTMAGNPGYHTFYHAPTVIMISADQNAQFASIDCGAAAQNITLAAALGIGSNTS
ncbi:nitroreductase family protein, partial [Candidatus Igneacidithiobacillus taiwanensis]|uniref:nitroreductase family protein n=1 Tax=Candidatus Igneacidithiobacillus taiwanensis TaxID=1945924 RepID=UPI00289EDDC0